jgi:uncharacterized protein involved in outer membrane biogenesis
MKRHVRSIIYVALGLAALAGMAAIAAWLLFKSLDLDAVVASVGRVVEEATGRPLAIGSEPQISFTPQPRLVVRDVRLANIAGGTRPDMLEVGQLEIGLDLTPLVQGNPPGLELVLIEPDLLLEAPEHGQPNWAFKRPRVQAATQMRQAVEILKGRVSLDTVRIERAVVRYDDRRQRRRIDLTVQRASFEIGPDDRSHVDLKGALGKIPVAIAAQLQGTASGIRAETLRLDIGRSTLRGAVELERLEPRPRLRAELEAKVLDLAELLSVREAASTAKSGNGRVFSATPLPLAGLRAFDLEARLRVDQLILPGSRRVDALQAVLSLADGRLKAEPLSLALGSGRASGRLHLAVPAAGNTAITTRVQAKGVELGSLVALAGLQGSGIRNGATDMAIELAASGDSVRTLMAALNGHARIVVGEGWLPGKTVDWSGSVVGQIVDVLNPYRESEDGSPLKCAVINVPVRRGVVLVKDTIAAETDKLAGTVTGSVNLGEERLDLVLHSQTTGGIAPGLGDFASAAKLTGTLGKPQLAVNAQGAAAAGLRVGAAVASAGITLLAGSVIRKTMPAHPCETALAGTAATESAGSQPSPAEPGRKEGGFLGRIRGR